MEGLKEILKDAYTEETDKAVDAVIGKLFVPRGEFNRVNEEKKTLTSTVADRDKQLEQLKATAGDSEQLKTEITKLQGENKTAAEKYATDLKTIKINTAIDARLAAEHAVDAKAVRALLDESKISLDGDNLLGIDEQLKALKTDKPWAFPKQEQQQEQQPAPRVGRTALPQGGGFEQMNGVQKAFFAQHPELLPKN